VPAPIIGDAAFSPCGRYRWWLERRWDGQRPRLLFIGLNPSRADGQRDDPTLRRLRGFAQAWGFGGLEVLNLFSRISPSPAVLRRSPEPVGALNDAWLIERLASLGPGDAVWLGWGNGGRWRQRDREVLALLQRHVPAETPLLALALTAAHQPRHPLYAPAAAQPQRLQHPGAVLRFAAPR
jgi:hypothetical protein